MGQAYDQLEQMLTPDQINALSSDTQRLVQQQAQLGESLKQIGPLLNTANTMLQTLGNAGAPVTKLLDKVGSFLDSSKESGVEIDPKNVDLKALTEQAQSLAAQSQKLAQQQAARLEEVFSAMGEDGPAETKDLNLLVKVRLASQNLVGLVVAVFRRAMFDDIGDKNLLAVQVDDAQ